MLRNSTMAMMLTTAMMVGACGNETGSNGIARTGKTVSVGTADLGGPFTLVDETGATVTEAALIGQPSLIYFGFSYCPDVCPVALQKLGAAQEIMGPTADEVQFILFSVDPERDTPEQLSLYVTNNGFPDGLRAFTGTVEQVDAVREAYKVYAQKVPMEDSSMGYTVDHQDVILLIGEDGKFVDFFTGRSTPTDIAQRVGSYVATGT